MVTALAEQGRSQRSRLEPRFSGRGIKSNSERIVTCAETTYSKQYTPHGVRTPWSACSSNRKRLLH